MTIFKSKKVKEIIENIKNEQLDNQLTNIERMEDWEERLADQTEQLHQVEKDLEEKIDKLDQTEEALRFYIQKTLKKEKEMEQRIEALEKKDESKQISLLKETHQKEIRELNDRFRIEKLVYGHAIEDMVEKNKKVEELEKVLEEKELLTEHLENEIKKTKEQSETHLDFIATCEKLNKDKDQLLRNKWMSAKKKAHDRKILLRKLEPKLLELENQSYLVNKPLPPLPKKQKKFQKLEAKVKTKFQNLIKRVKNQEQEMVARVEVIVNK